jgi:L-aspartate oxidase
MLADPVSSRRDGGQTPDVSARDKVTAELRQSMWRDCGLVRDGAGLEKLLRAPHLVARLIARSALFREESRGSHFRADFPHEDARLDAHVVLRRGQEPVWETWL